MCVIAIDSSLSDNFGRSIIYALSASTTLLTVSVVGGLPFVVVILILSAVYWNGKLLLLHSVPIVLMHSLPSCQGALLL
jgi:hypothetical protein